MTRPARADIAAARRIVVKVGSSSLTTADGSIDDDRIVTLADSLAERAKAGTHLVLVSSGAIAAGIAPLGLPSRPRLVALNKIDVPAARELADMVKETLAARGLQVYEVSAATREGLRELGFAMAGLVGSARAAAPAPQPTRRVIRPKPAGPDFEIIRTPAGAYLVRGEKPRRWLLQTDFSNDEAVGFLADRLARLGVEEALGAAGAEAGDEILIGDLDDAVVFDWDPTVPMGDGSVGVGRGPRGSDRRLPG